MTTELMHAAEMALDYLTGERGAHAAQVRKALTEALRSAGRLARRPLTDAEAEELSDALSEHV